MPDKWTRPKGIQSDELDGMAQGVMSELGKCANYRATNIEPIWDKMTDVYRVKEYKNRENWQSCAPNTRLAIGVDLISAFIYQMYLNAGDAIVEIDSSYTAGTAFGAYGQVEEQIRRELQRQILAQLNKSDVRQKILELSRSMLIYGTTGIKCPWQDYDELDNFTDPARPKLVPVGRQMFDMPIFPGNIYRDYSRLGRYEITTYNISKGELVALAENNKDIYDVEACKAAKTGTRSPYGGNERSKTLADKYLQDQAQQGGEDSDVVQVLEIWGGIPDKNGTIKRRYSWAAMVGDKFIVKPRYYSSWDAQPPIIIACQNPRPHEVWPVPWLYYFYHTGEALGQMKRLMIDKAKWGGHPVIGIRSNVLTQRMTASEFGISPGDLFEMNDTSGNAELLSVNNQLATFPQEMFGVMGMLEADYNMSGHSEMLHGGAAPKGRTTAEEIQTRRQMLGAQQQFMVLMLENALSKLFTKVRNNILQYMPPERWLDMGRAFGDETDPKLSPEKKQQIIQMKQGFTEAWKANKGIAYSMVREPNLMVNGITAAYKRTKESEALGNMMAMTFQNPMSTLLMGVDPSRLASEFLWRIDGIDPDKLLLSPPDEREAIVQGIMANTFGRMAAPQEAPVGKMADTPVGGQGNPATAAMAQGGVQ